METVSQEKKNIEIQVGKSLVTFGEDILEFGGAQKFVIAKSKNEFHFVTMPEKKHPEMFADLENECGEKIESLGGAVLNLFGNEIIIDRSSKSLNLGPLKISWQETQEIIQNAVGNKYNVVLSEI